MLFVPGLPQQAVANDRVALDAAEFFLQKAAAVGVDVHDDRTLAHIVVQAAVIGGLQQLRLPGLHFGCGLAAQQADEGGGVRLDHPPEQRFGQVRHHRGVHIGRLVAGEDALQDLAVVVLFPVRLHQNKLPDGNAGHTGVFIDRHLVQIPVRRCPLLRDAVGQLGTVLRTQKCFIIKEIGRTGQVAVDAVRRMILFAGLVDHFQQVFHDGAGRAFSGMVERRMVKVAHPPVLQAGLLAPVRALVLVDIRGRPQHPLCDHGVVVLPQVGQLGHLVHVHSIDVPLPGDVRVHLLIIGRLDDPERRLKQFLIPAAVFFRPARDRHPDVAHAPDDILPGLLVQLFIPGNVVGPLQKEGMDARPQQVDVVVLIPHIDIVQGDAVVVQLPDDHGDIVAETGRLQQQLMDLVGHAAVLAVGIVEQPARRLFQLGDVVVGQRFRVPRIDQLPQQGVVLLH